MRGDLIVSKGDDNDGGMIVWESKTPRMLSANLMKKSKIRGIVFTQDTESEVSFVSYGTNKHLKLWKVKVEHDDYLT